MLPTDVLPRLWYSSLDSMILNVISLDVNCSYKIELSYFVTAKGPTLPDAVISGLEAIWLTVPKYLSAYT